jgi:hypothetical protein
VPTASLNVSVDAPEYSPYYAPLRYITAFVDTDSSDPASTVTVTLVREDGYGDVMAASKSLDIAGVVGTAQVTLDLLAARDSVGIFRAIKGRYHVRVKASDSILTAVSESFRITPCSVAELKDTLLNGIDMLASNVIKPLSQPTNITGVTIVASSTTQLTGIFPLQFFSVGPYLSWDGGEQVRVATVSGRQVHVIANGDKTSWIQVEVQSQRLPNSDQTDNIVMDLDRVSDEDIAVIADRVYGSLQGRIQTFLEPRELDTDNIGSPLYDPAVFVDEFRDPVTYYKIDWGRKWFSMKFPTSNIIRVTRLGGFFQQSHAFEVPIDQWLVKNSKGGLVEFVPKNGAILSFQFFGVPFFAYMHLFEHIPSFWHYHLTAGLPDLSNDFDRVRVRTALLRWVAMDVLVQAGMASAPGLIGESTAKDGVSESRSYAQGAGGRYANIVSVHKDFLFGPDGNAGEVKSLRDKFVGVMMVIL